LKNGLFVLDLLEKIDGGGHRWDAQFIVQSLDTEVILPQRQMTLSTPQEGPHQAPVGIFPAWIGVQQSATEGNRHG
jgi:hypothetical protein